VTASVKADGTLRVAWRDWNANIAASDAWASDLAMRTLHGDVLRAAGQRRFATALRQGQRVLSYGELFDAVTARTARLVALGVHEGDRVLLLASRGIDFVLDALAIMNAGAAYVPIDPSLPPSRIAKFVQAASAIGLVSRQRFARLAATIEPSWWDLSLSAETRGEISRAGTTTSERSLAYMIFTSGTTGDPKAVCLDHVGRTSMIEDLNRRLGLGPDDAVLVVSSPSFDMSVYDTFGLLAAGARVVFPDEGRENDVEHWVDILVEQGVTVWHSVPSAMSLVLAALKRRHISLEVMRVVLLGGDWIPVSQPAAVRRRMPTARVISLGGATEASVDSVIFETRVDDDFTVSIPYGRSLDRQTAYVVDPDGRLAEIGKTGELALGGVGVAWGYHGQPAVTALRFVPDPFGDDEGARLYLTGDAARLDASGDLQLLGRLDQQVKVGGIRVEMGEIDAHLRTVTDVAEACTVAVSGGAATATLASFVTLAGGQGADHDAVVRDCRRRLHEALHASMIPAQIKVVPALPLSPNGKIDRTRLQSWALERPPLDVTPDPSGERGLVAAVWSDVLDVVVTVDTSAAFSDLGGTSLAAAQVVIRLNAAASTDLRLRDVMRARTVGEVATLVAAARSRVGNPASSAQDS